MDQDYTKCCYGDLECDGPLAKPNRPCCDQCAEKYWELVDQGKISDFVNNEGLVGDIEVQIVETQEDLVGKVTRKVWH